MLYLRCIKAVSKGATTFGMIAFSITTFSTTINKMQLNITTLSIMPLDTKRHSVVSFLLSITNKSFILSVVMLNVVMLSVAAPSQNDKRGRNYNIFTVVINTKL